MAHVAIISIAGAQTTIPVTVGSGTGPGSLPAAIAQANAATGSIEIQIQSGLTITPPAQMVIGIAAESGLNIVGNGATIDMSGANGGAGDRAFFIAWGTVDIANLTISGGRARGGEGATAAGGGAGLGGGVFIGNGQAITGMAQPATVVNLANVQFIDNHAIGGSSGIGTQVTRAWGGGGGGMGGNGGVHYSESSLFGEETAGGGGGGFGVGSDGGAGDSNAGATGAFPLLAAGGGAGGFDGADGGANGGGGGGGSKGLEFDGGGGGGGIFGGGPNHSTGSNGGFGGGGGGGGSADSQGGTGGFGGGGGAGYYQGNGGFGGGGAGQLLNPSGDTSPASLGGFGGGNGNTGAGGTISAPGGGAGLGGAVFAMGQTTVTITDSSFTASATVAGQGAFPANNGSAYGDDVFLGGDVTFDISTQQTVTNLGGAGNTADPNVIQHTTDPNANGGLVKIGDGTLTLAGSSFYSGATLVAEGTLAFAPDATETGTASVQVNFGATLALPSNNILLPLGPSPTFTLNGTLAIGSGIGTSGANFGAPVIAGDSTGQILFQQAKAFGGEYDVYPFYAQIVGGVGVTQSGPGITLLQPIAGPNTYAGGTTITDGTLRAGSTTSLPTSGDVTVTDGSLDINGFDIFIDELRLNGGSVEDDLGGGSLVTDLTATGGVLLVDLTGSSTLTKTGPGTTIIGEVTTFTGTTTVAAGTLALDETNGLSGTSSVVVEADGTLSLWVSDAINDTATLTLSGGTLLAEGSITESLGSSLIQATSVLDTGVESLALTFSSLTLSATLDVWQWSGSDSLNVNSLTGPASLVRFYSDTGSTFLGHGFYNGSQIIAVPEPAAAAGILTLVAAAGLARIVRRHPKPSTVAKSDLSN